MFRDYLIADKINQVIIIGYDVAGKERKHSP